ncbi:hypothetical protein AB0K57_04870 [Streptomyces halstedii]
MVIVVEVLFVLVALVGVGMWSVPAALVLAGVLGALAVERWQAERKGTL